MKEDNLASVGVNVNMSWNVAAVLIVTCLVVFISFFATKRLMQ